MKNFTSYFGAILAFAATIGMAILAISEVRDKKNSTSVRWIYGVCAFLLLVMVGIATYTML